MPRRRLHFLREWAESYGISRSQIIAVTGADKSLVSRWLGPLRAEPSPEYLDQIAKLLGTTAERIYAPPPAATAPAEPPDPKRDMSAILNRVAEWQAADDGERLQALREYMDQLQADPPQGGRGGGRRVKGS